MQLKQLKSNMRAPMPTPLRWIAVILAVLAAASFALGVQSAWWSLAEVAVGPFGSRHCFGGECRASGLGWVIGADDLWMRSAVATRAAGYIAMVALLMFAGALAAKREPRLVARGTLASIVTAIAVGAYFGFAFPGLAGASIGRGVFLFVAAIALGTVAVVLFMTAPRREPAT